jgi:hypothetical protein
MPNPFLIVVIRLAAMVLGLVAVSVLISLISLVSADNALVLAWGFLVPLVLAATALGLWLHPAFLLPGRHGQADSTAVTALDETALWRAGCSLIGLYLLVAGLIDLAQWSLSVAFIHQQLRAGMQMQWQWVTLLGAALSLGIGLGLLLGREGMTKLYWSLKG